MVHIYYDGSVDFYDALRSVEDDEVVGLVKDLLDEGYTPEGWRNSQSVDCIDLSDPADRLAAITELRKLGYTVEPGGR